MRNPSRRTLKNSVTTLIMPFAFGAFLTSLSTGCAGPDNEQTAKAVDKLSERLQMLLSEGDKTLDAVTSLSSDQALGEFKKLKQFEYRIVSLPLSLSSEAQEQQLNQLGAEGWECFSVVPGTTEFRVYCRKRPDTPLRFVPNSVLGR